MDVVNFQPDGDRIAIHRIAILPKYGNRLKRTLECSPRVGSVTRRIETSLYQIDFARHDTQRERDSVMVSIDLCKGRYTLDTSAYNGGIHSEN